MKQRSQRWAIFLVAGIVLAVSLLSTAADGATSIVWSWEQVLEPLDILTFAEDLPYDEWIEIDEVTCRRLFEDLIQRSLEQMEIDGGHFEQMLRERFFYFTPEREYYYPVYEEDSSAREVLFPVEIMRDTKTFADYDTLEEVLKIQFGRFSDDARKMIVVWDSTGLSSVELNRKLCYPGETGHAKTKELALDFYLGKGYVTERWFNDGNPLDDILFNENDTLFIGAHRLFEYEAGDTTPVLDNTAGELALDLSGIDILFDLSGFPKIYDHKVFQTYNSLINLCKLQLHLDDDERELEALLWRNLFYYDRGADYFGSKMETFSARRTYYEINQSSQARFILDGGNATTGRDVTITLSQNCEDIEAGYSYGLESIVLTRRNVLVGDDERGQEKKELTIRETPSGIVLECWVKQYDSDGAEIARWRIARFEEGNPNNLALP